jgi:hypothetical protein
MNRLDALDLAGPALVVIALVCLIVAIGIDRHREPPAGSLACHAAGGWWVAATLDLNGNPKMFACVDDAGRLVRLQEAK